MDDINILPSATFKILIATVCLMYYCTFALVKI